MSNSIFIEVTDDAKPPQWFNVKETQTFLEKVFAVCSYDNWELSVLFCSAPFIQNLNRQYRGIDQATDVLSFPQSASPYDTESDANADWPAEVSECQTQEKPDIFVAGDIVVCFEILTQNAAYFHVPEENELKRLLIHGVLHLGGYDHKTNDPSEPMLTLQEKLLREVEK